MPDSASAIHDRPLRCVHYLHEFVLEHGGVVQAVRDLCSGLTAGGTEIVLLTCDASDVPDAWQRGANGTRVVELNRSRLYRGMLGRRIVRDATRTVLARADVVHLHTPWAVGNLQLAASLRRQRIPYIVSIHGMLDGWSMAQKPLKKRTFLTLGGRRFLYEAARVHFTAEEERRQALAWIPAARRRAVVVPLTVDLSQFDQLPGPDTARAKFKALDSGEPTVLFLSRLHPKKGVELLLDAATQLHAAGARFQLVVAGPADDAAYVAALQRQAAVGGLGDRVHFPGMVRGVEKLSLYQAADVFVLPTHQENFGLVLVEAMACETPVVTTRGTDIWRELEAGGAVIVDRSAPSIAAAIGEILGDRKTARHRAQRGRAFVYQWLDRRRVMEQYEQLYRSAIQQSDSPLSIRKA